MDKLVVAESETVDEVDVVDELAAILAFIIGLGSWRASVIDLVKWSSNEDEVTKTSFFVVGYEEAAMKHEMEEAVVTQELGVSLRSEHMSEKG